MHSGLWNPPLPPVQVRQVAAYSSLQTSCLPHPELWRRQEQQGEEEALHKTMALSQDKRDACSPLFMIVIRRNKTLCGGLHLGLEPGAHSSLFPFPSFFL